MKEVTVSVSLIAVTLILFMIPFSPGCFCVEDSTLGPADIISQEYEGYILRDDNDEALLFRIVVLWERSEGIVGTLSLYGDTTEVYGLEDINFSNGVLSFTVTIESLANVPLDFEATADGRFLSGTFERTGGASIGELIAVSVEGVIGRELDMVGAYELITTYTYGDTLGDVYSDSLAVRLEFERDGTFMATSRLLPEGEELLESGVYAVDDNYLLITLEGATADLQLPLSLRGFVVNKDLVLLSSPGPFPSFEVLTPVSDGVQVEQFKQVY
jgi:hypothetical protein